MNKISGIISELENEGNLTIVHMKAGESHFKTIILDDPKESSYLKVDTPVEILFKETEVSISTKPLSCISLSNQIPGTITAIEKGKLLSQIVLDCDGKTIVSIITTSSTDRLGLEIGKKVYSLVKTNELMISKPS